MDRGQFWTIVNNAKEASGGSHDRRYRSLVCQLTARSGGEIIAFEEIMGEVLDDAYRWDLWAAARIMADGCSDDGFQDFRRWVVSLGEEAYLDVLADPESLIKWQVGEDDVFFEAFGWVANEAYKISVGRIMAEDMEEAVRTLARPVKEHAEPAGVRWTDEESAQRFPRLYARFHVKEQ
jgi:hypothetical protein